MATYKTAEAADPKPAVVFPTGIVPVTFKHKTVAMSTLTATKSTLELLKVPAGAQILRWKVKIPAPTTAPSGTTATMTVVQEDTPGSPVALTGETSINTGNTLVPTAAQLWVDIPYANGDGVVKVELSGGSGASAFVADQEIEVIFEYTLENSERFEMAPGQ